MLTILSMEEDRNFPSLSFQVGKALILKARIVHTLRKSYRPTLFKTLAANPKENIIEKMVPMSVFLTEMES